MFEKSSLNTAGSFLSFKKFALTIFPLLLLLATLPLVALQLQKANDVRTRAASNLDADAALPSPGYLENERARQKALVDNGRIKIYMHLTGAARDINKDLTYENEAYKFLKPVNPQEFWESIPPVYPPDAPLIPGTNLRKLPNPVTLKTVWTLTWDDTGKWAGYDPGGAIRTVKEPALFLEVWDASPMYGQGAYAVSLALSDVIGEERPLPSWTHLTYIDGTPLTGWPTPYGKIYWNARVWSTAFRFYDIALTPTPSPTPTLTAPNAPSNLTATSLGGGKVSLTWVDNSINEDAFRIERRIYSSSSFTQIATVGSNITSYVDGGLTPGYYYYKVRACNIGSCSSYSNTVFVLAR